MDIMMPRKDGITALHELRADSRLDHTTIIALTARPYMVDELFRAGFDDVCSKPIDLEELWTMTTRRGRTQ
jgi:CheY-like chemotaxis protein